MRKGRFLYFSAVHILAILGVVQVIGLLAGLNAGQPSRIDVRVQGVIAPDELPPLPRGEHKSEWRAEQAFIDGQPVARFWFRNGQLNSMEFCPPGGLTLRSLTRNGADFADSGSSGAHWSSSTDTVRDGENPWSSFPTLSISDKAGLGVPSLAIFWDGTSAKRTLRGRELWDELAGLSNAGELPDGDAGEGTPDH